MRWGRVFLATPLLTGRLMQVEVVELPRQLNSEGRAAAGARTSARAHVPVIISQADPSVMQQIKSHMHQAKREQFAGCHNSPVVVWALCLLLDVHKYHRSCGGNGMFTWSSSPRRLPESETACKASARVVASLLTACAAARLRDCSLHWLSSCAACPSACLNILHPACSTHPCQISRDWKYNQPR